VDVLFNQLSSKWVIKVTYEVSPGFGSFILITFPASAYAVVCVRSTSSRARMYVVNCKFVNVIGFSAIDTCAVEVFFDCASPYALGFW
jgi:hypothetical protein